MSEVNEIMVRVDWPLLQRQKRYLLELQAVEDSDLLNGLINFLDVLQDAAVSAGIATAAEVFGRAEGLDK